MIMLPLRMPDYKKYYIIPASPADIFNALTNEATAMLWTGDQASIDAQVNGEFSLWDDAIVGRFLSLEFPKKIVQEWYFGDIEPASIVTIKLHEHKKGTSFELLHTNIPEDAYADITEGWDEEIIGSLIDFYAEG